MTHLGDRISALVDGELDHDARDRALAHLSRCAACSRAVAEERWLKSRLRALPPSEPSADLLAALFTPSPAGGLGRQPAVDGVRAGLMLAGAGSVSVGMLALAYLLGGTAPTGDPVAPVVSPAVGQFSAEFADTTGGMPFSDPAVVVFPTTVAGVSGSR